MTNPHRGEVEMDLNGVKVTMRPTFEAMANIERLTGKALTVLADEFTTGRGKVTDAAIIIHAGLNAAGNKINLDVVGTRVFEMGAMNAFKPATAFLSSALTAGQVGPDEMDEESDPEGEVKAATN